VVAKSAQHRQLRRSLLIEVAPTRGVRLLIGGVDVSCRVARSSSATVLRLRRGACLSRARGT
jgi:hypothetical protein